MARLNQKKVEILVKRKQKGLSSKLIAKQLGISKRRVNQVWKEYINTGEFVLKKTGKPNSKVLTEEEKEIILGLQQTSAGGGVVTSEEQSLFHNVS